MKVLDKFYFVILLASIFGVSACGNSTNDAATDMAIVPNEVSIAPLEKIQLRVEPPMDKAVLWSVEDPSIATISTTGLLSAKRVGHTRAIAEVMSNKLYCSVEIKEHPPVFPADGRLIPLKASVFKEKVWDYTTTPSTFIYKADKPAVINFWTEEEHKSEEMLELMKAFAKKNAGKGYVFTIDVGKTADKMPERDILKAFVNLQVPSINDYTFPAFVLVRRNSPKLDGLTGATATNITVMQSFFNTETNH